MLVRVYLKKGDVYHNLRITEDQFYIIEQLRIREGETAAQHLLRLWYNSRKKENRANRQAPPPVPRTYKKKRRMAYKFCAMKRSCHACMISECTARTQQWT